LFSSPLWALLAIIFFKLLLVLLPHLGILCQPLQVDLWPSAYKRGELVNYALLPYTAHISWPQRSPRKKKMGKYHTLVRHGLAHCGYGCGKETVMSSPLPWLPCGHAHISSFLLLHISHFPSLRFRFGKHQRWSYVHIICILWRSLYVGGVCYPRPRCRYNVPSDGTTDPQILPAEILWHE
jgi:hypothetical protein